MSPDWVSALADVVVAVSAGVAAWYARSGLMTWQQEMKGRTEYETARRFLRATLKVRDAFEYIRRSIGLFGEAPTPREGEVDRMQRKLQQEWPILDEAMIELETEAMEAEVLWEQRLELLVMELHFCQIYLREAFEDYMKCVDEKDPEPAEKRKALKETIYAGSGKGEFSMRIENAVKAIKEEIRPFLARER